MFSHTVRVAIGVFGVALATIMSTPGQADDRNLKQGVQRLGEGVGKFFKSEGLEPQITISAFVSDDGEQSSEFKRLLEADLKKQKPPFNISRADVVLSGRLTKAKGKANTDDRFESVALKVEAKLNRRGAEGDLQKFSIDIFGDEAIQFLGPSTEFPKDLPEGEKQEKLDKQTGTKSEVFLNGNETLGAKGGQFAVEILVRQGTGKAGVPRAPAAVNGQSFVKLGQKEEYIVRLHNKSSDETAVVLTIDGLSMFTFAEDATSDSLIIVPAGKFVEVPGWYINAKKTDVFEVSNYTESAAASKSLSKEGIGVITARFHITQSGEGKGEEATRRGRRIDQEYEQVRRVIGATRAFVSVRYNRDGK